MRTSVVSVVPTGNHVLVKGVIDFSLLTIQNAKPTDRDNEKVVKFYVVGFGENVKPEAFAIGQRVIPASASHLIKVVDVPENNKSLEKLREFYASIPRDEWTELLKQKTTVESHQYIIFNEFTICATMDEFDSELRTAWESKVQQA